VQSDGLAVGSAEAIAAEREAALVADAAQYEVLKIRARREAMRLDEEEQHEGHVYTWAQVDHDSAFAAMANGRPMPDIGYMTSTPNSPPFPLLYSGKINGVHGDSEAGKSWFSQHIATQELRASRHVLYLDFEDDASGVYGRLLELGATEDQIRTYFHYVNPQNKLTVFEQLGYAKLIGMDKTHSLAVVDGVTEAMSLESLTGRDENEVAKWHQLVTKPLAAKGWGVFMIDHMPHGESRAIGSQHKRSAITGVSYSLDSIANFAPGASGRSRIHVVKDRPGWIRSAAAPGKGAGGQWYGDFVLDATLHMLQPSIWPWKQDEAEGKGYEEGPQRSVMDAIAAFVDKHQGCTGRTIRTAVKGRAQSVLWALDHMVETGALRTESGPRNALLHYVDHDPDRVVPSGSEWVPGTGESVVPPDTPVRGSGNQTLIPDETEESGNHS